MEDTQIEETKAYADYEAEQEFLASLWSEGHDKKKESVFAWCIILRVRRRGDHYHNLP